MSDVQKHDRFFINLKKYTKIQKDCETNAKTCSSSSLFLASSTFLLSYVLGPAMQHGPAVMSPSTPSTASPRHPSLFASTSLHRSPSIFLSPLSCFLFGSPSPPACVHALSVPNKLLQRQTGTDIIIIMNCRTSSRCCLHSSA